MAKFSDHLVQSRSNLTFLENICATEKDHWDWKVTVCFYSAVHLINAHIAFVSNQHYRSHEDVNRVINYNNAMSPCRIEEDDYLAYMKLRNLSRRSRYLVNDKASDNSINAFFTYDKHFAKAIKNLDVVIDFFNRNYKLDFPVVKVRCLDLKGVKLNHFEVASA